MKIIPLTKGKETIVDEEDYDYLMQWKWHIGTHGYAIRTAYYGGGAKNPKTKKILMHRELLGIQNGFVVDHIDGNKLNNTKANLRTASVQQNVFNRKMQSNCKSGYKGVYWHKQQQKWCSYIKCAEKRIHIGLFDCKKDAALAYNFFALEYFGDFAFFNKSEFSQ